MVVLLLTDQNSIFSAGDDAVVRVWGYENKEIVEKESKEYNTRPNLLFSL
jgi:hypothetical protein